MSTSNDLSPDRHQHLALQIRVARARCAYSVEALAKLAGVEPSVIVRMERGELTEGDAVPCERVLNTLGLGTLARR